MSHLKELVALVPGLILAWAALIVWSRPILRFLSGRQTADVSATAARHENTGFPGVP
jgi:hypothetical protein